MSSRKVLRTNEKRSEGEKISNVREAGKELKNVLSMKKSRIETQMAGMVPLQQRQRRSRPVQY